MCERNLTNTTAASVQLARGLSTPRDATTQSRVALGRAYRFTTLGSTGPEGPTSTAGYSGTTLDGLVTLSAGIQVWTVPMTGRYRIEAQGASGLYFQYTGANPGEPLPSFGTGAIAAGDILLSEGERLKILVGQLGRLERGAGPSIGRTTR